MERGTNECEDENKCRSKRATKSKCGKKRTITIKTSFCPRTKYSHFRYVRINQLNAREFCTNESTFRCRCWLLLFISLAFFCLMALPTKNKKIKMNKSKCASFDRIELNEQEKKTMCVQQNNKDRPNDKNCAVCQTASDYFTDFTIIVSCLPFTSGSANKNFIANLD